MQVVGANLVGVCRMRHPHEVCARVRQRGSCNARRARREHAVVEVRLQDRRSVSVDDRKLRRVRHRRKRSHRRPKDAITRIGGELEEVVVARGKDVRAYDGIATDRGGLNCAIVWLLLTFERLAQR